MTALGVILAALLLDAWLGEPRRFHPLVGLGRLAEGVERRLNRGRWRRLRGGAALASLLMPALAVAVVLDHYAGPWLDALVLYLTIGLKSLHDHVRPVTLALERGELVAARAAVARLVSRDPEGLDERGVARAATESVLENGSDALFASLFWYLAAGLPGVVAHRVVNTLDAMWGYRTDRFREFGWAAARLDDVLNWLPARLTALSYALAGDLLRALRCWQLQGGRWESPNAGPVMAAGAGALGVRLGGPAHYHGRLRRRPLLGKGIAPSPETPAQALALLRRALGWWLALIALGGWAVG